MTTILHITWGLETGGKERFIYRLVRGLDPERFKSEIWTLRARGPFYEKLLAEGYALQHLDKRPGVDMRTIRNLRRRIRAHNPDVIHAHDFTSALAALAALCFRKQPPLVMTLHGGHMDLTWPRKKLHRQLMKRAAAVTAVSEQMADAVRRQSGESIAVRHIPSGIDTDTFRVSPSAPALRTELGIPPDGPLVAGTMRMEKPKDPRLIMKAAALVRQSRPDCRFVLVGEGPLRPALFTLIHELGLENNVFLPGYRSDIPDILAIADVCVLAGRREGLPLAILEYMAAGKPVVATRVGGVGELVRDGTTGYLVEMGDAAAMADRIMLLLDKPETAAALGQHGLQLVNTRFNEPAMIAAYEALYGKTGAMPASSR